MVKMEVFSSYLSLKKLLINLEITVNSLHVTRVIREHIHKYGEKLFLKKQKKHQPTFRFINS